MRNNSFALKPAAVAMFLLTVRCFAQSEPLPLKHGNYVQESYSCTRPPFAAMMSWDGIGFWVRTQADAQPACLLVTEIDTPSAPAVPRSVMALQTVQSTLRALL